MSQLMYARLIKGNPFWQQLMPEIIHWSLQCCSIYIIYCRSKHLPIFQRTKSQNVMLYARTDAFSVIGIVYCIKIYMCTSLITLSYNVNKWWKSLYQVFSNHVHMWEWVSEKCFMLASFSSVPARWMTDMALTHYTYMGNRTGAYAWGSNMFTTVPRHLWCLIIVCSE